MTRDKDIKSYSAAELKRMRERGDSRTDWAAVRAKPEEELERDIASDPDWREIPANWYAGAEAVYPDRKTRVSIRLDSDVVGWFKAQGPDCQSRINAALRKFMLDGSRTS